MTTTTDGTLLLRAVLDSPDDDTPRLVYADWLDENGQPERAEFVRVQCRIAAIRRECGCGGCAKLRGGGQHHNGPCDADRRQDDGVKLRRREQELFTLHGADWFGRTGCLTPPNDRERAAGGTFLVVRRGFIESVICTLAAFMGGVCGCNRRGDFVYDGLGSLHCPVCRGSGTTTGIAAALFGAHPVTGVTLTDREPSHASAAYPDGPPGCFGWWSDPADDLGVLSPSPEQLPRALWDKITGHRPHRGTAPHWKWFPTRDAALLALSRACVLYGRSLAGLSDLTPDQIQ